LFHSVDFTRSRGIWCDGVLQLSIARLHRLGLAISGVCYCPHELAPFELEFHFERRRDLVPLRTVLRFGDLGHGRNGAMHTSAKNAVVIVANRPKRNQDWAVAVELTTPKS
jgi:hypothetical protein